MSEARDPVRVGIIGAGAISQVVHLPIFAERKDVQLVALADADEHKAETLSRRFDVPLVMKTEELLDHDEIDAVVICTPNAVHEDIAIRAFESDKHVLLERPAATTAQGVSRVLNAAEKAGRILTVGLPHRYRPEVIALKSLVVGGELGELFAMRGSWLTRSTPMSRSSWRRDPGVAGGGALVDLGIPALDLCMWVVGFPVARRVSCIVAKGDNEVEHSATVMIETTEGLAFSLEVTNRLFAGEDRYYVRVMGSEGSGALPPLEVYRQLGGRPIEVTPRQPTPRGGENAYMNAYRRLLDHFVRCVSGIASAPLPTEQVHVMEIIEAAYRSAERGEEVVL